MIAILLMFLIVDKQHVLCIEISMWTSNIMQACDWMWAALMMAHSDHWTRRLEQNISALSGKQGNLTENQMTVYF